MISRASIAVPAVVRTEVRIRDVSRGLVLVSVLAAFALACGLPGDFFLDSVLFIKQNPLLKLDALNLGELLDAGFGRRRWPAYRAPAMVSFAVQDYFGVGGPGGIKFGNILIHLAIGAAVFGCTFRISCIVYPGARSLAAWLALFTASFWLLHPLQVSTVLYSFQRVTQLSALACVLGLWAYVSLRQRSLQGSTHVLAAPTCLAGFTLAAIACKENGVLLPLYALLAEAVFFRFRTADGNGMPWLLPALFIAFCILPLLFLAIYYTSPEVAAQRFAVRPFDLRERVLTEWRIMMQYLRLILIPDPRQMSLYHDGVVVSRGWWAPPSTIVSALGLLVLAGAAAACRRRMPLAAFGFGLWLGSHYLESTFMSLELMFEHRNYFGLFGIGLVLASLSARLFTSHAARTVLVSILVAALGVATATRAAAWSSPERFYRRAATQQPDSARALTSWGLYQLRQASHDDEPDTARAKGRETLLAAAEADPNGTLALAHLLVIHLQHDGLIPDRVLRELNERMARPPNRHEKVHALKVLAACSSEPCREHAERLYEPFASALAQPGIPSGAKLLEVAAAMRAERVGDPSGALELMQRAVASAPNWTRGLLQLTHLLIGAGALDEAAATLERAESTDRADRFSMERTQLALALDRARLQQGGQ